MNGINASSSTERPILLESTPDGGFEMRCCSCGLCIARNRTLFSAQKQRKESISPQKQTVPWTMWQKLKLVLQKDDWATDCRQCDYCEISEYLPDDKISFSCLLREIATDHCRRFLKGTPKEVEWIND